MGASEGFKQSVDMGKTAIFGIEAFYNLVGKSLGVAENVAERMVHAWIKRGDEVRLNKAITAILGATKDKNDMLVFTPVAKEAAETFSALYQRDLNRPAMIADFLQEDLVADGIGDLKGSTFNGIHGKEDLMNLNNPAFVSLESERERIIAIRSETYARMGLAAEIDREYTKPYIDNLQDNPMQEIKGLSLAEYETLKRDVQKLPKDMRFTLFPEYRVGRNGNTTVNVGFLTKTGGINAKNAYNISEIVKNILVKEKVIENSQYGFDFITKMEKEAENRDAIVNEFIRENPLDIKNAIRSTYELNAPQELKEELEECIRENFYSLDNQELKLKIDEIMKQHKDINYNELLHVLDNENEKSYIMKADVFIDDKTGKKKLKFDRENYAVIAKNMTIRQSGEKDIVIGDSEDDKKSTAYRTEHQAQELGAAMQKWQRSEESTVVRLSSKEFKSIMNGSAIREMNEISYFDNHEEAMALDKEAVAFIEDATTVSKRANVELRDELKTDSEIDRELIFGNDTLYEKTDSKDLKEQFVEQSEYADTIRISKVTMDRTVERTPAIDKITLTPEKDEVGKGEGR